MKSSLIFPVLFLIVVSSSFCNSQNTEIDSLKRVLRRAASDTARVNLYNGISNNYKESNPDSTAFYAKKASQLASKISYSFGAAESYLNIGNSNIILGRYDKAEAEFLKAREAFARLSDDSQDKRNLKGLAKAHASLGVVYSEKNNYLAALDNYQKALKIYLKNDDKSGVSKVYNNLGNIYKAQGSLEDALDSYKKALKIQQQTGEQAAAVSFTNIGAILLEQRKYPEAFRYYSDAESLFAESGNKRGHALLKNYIGDYYLAQNDFENALKSYETSLKMYDELQNKHGASLVLYNLGKLFERLEKNTEALAYAEKSLQYSRETGLRDQAYRTEKLLSELYENSGKAQEALLHFKQYVALRDSVYTAENQRKFMRSQMDFEYQMKSSLLEEQNKRQRLIVMFSVLAGLLAIGVVFLIFNRRQVKRRLTLQKEVSEYEQKALHLQMNPHFVFNCLGAISSFIVQNGTDSALRYLSKFSKLMRLTLEYSKDSLIPIDKEIEGLQNYLELEQLRFHNSFEFAIHSSDKVEFNMGLPPLLVQPFVENAILHGLVPKEGHGRIDVNFNVVENQLVCTITDSGIGITKSKEMKAHSVQAHQSMALDITKKRLEIMEATISKSAQIDISEIEANGMVSGTRVTLKLPIQYIQ